MACVHFWAKPGCQTNARQQAALRAAGHELAVHDLLHEPWSAQRLLDFFIDLPIEAWFNLNAPAVKSGDVVPALFDSGSALRAMLAQPLLIRRPLIEVDGQRCVGFEHALVRQLLGSADSPGEACSGGLPRCIP